MLEGDELIDAIKETWEDVIPFGGGEPKIQVKTDGWPWQWRTKVTRDVDSRFEEEDQTAHNE